MKKDSFLHQSRGAYFSVKENKNFKHHRIQTFVRDNFVSFCRIAAYHTNCKVSVRERAAYWLSISWKHIRDGC